MRGEGGERRRGRFEDRIFPTQLFEFVYPDVSVIYDIVELFARL